MSVIPKFRLSIQSVGCVLCIICISIASVVPVNTVSDNSITRPDWLDNEEVKIFRAYLRLPTVQPNIDYKPTVEFLKKQAASLDLPVEVYYPVNANNPVVVMTWEGSQPELPSIMLNSHMDVVPVYEEYWTHPPFAAEIDENGNIYARGAQDTKAVGIQYLAAIRALKRLGINQLKRTIHVTFVPDEEAGIQGMDGFVKTDDFKRLNIGFALDEGSSSEENDTMPAFYDEKIMWEIEFIFNGQSGHGSHLFNNTPGEKLNYVVNKMMMYRKEELKKITELNYPVGNVTSINLTVLKGGVQHNVIPAEMSATFDIRISPNQDVDAFEEQIKRWCVEAGGNITMRNIFKGNRGKPTPVDDSNAFWTAFKSGVASNGFKVEPSILFASSDSTYLRQMNISTIGFSPMFKTEERAHDHDEYLNVNTFLAGIEVYKEVIRNVGNV